MTTWDTLNAFRYICEDNILHNTDFDAGKIIELRNAISDSDYRNPSDLNLCIVPRAFVDLEQLALCHYHDDDDHYDDLTDVYYCGSMRGIIPMEEILLKMTFMKVKPIKGRNKYYSYLILEVFDGEALLSYWHNKNTFPIQKEMSKMGISESFLNTIPINHNYLDMYSVCSCGHTGCGCNYVWLYRYENTYAIPFMFNHNNLLYFEVDDGAENSDEERDLSLFTYEEFELYEPLLFENRGYLK